MILYLLDTPDNAKCSEAWNKLYGNHDSLISDTDQQRREKLDTDNETAIENTENLELR